VNANPRPGLRALVLAGLNLGDELGLAVEQVSADSYDNVTLYCFGTDPAVVAETLARHGTWQRADNASTTRHSNVVEVRPDWSVSVAVVVTRERPS
jgi:hypothetical protein